MRELVRQLQMHSLPDSNRIAPLVILTGGGSAFLAPHMDEEVRYEPLLTLQGLALVAQKISGDQ